VRALVQTAGLSGRQIRAGHIAFILAPRLNAAGRIEDAMDGVRLLLSDDPEEALDLARRLETVNARRQAMDESMLREAVERVETEIGLDTTYGLVVANEGWHPGVVGLVASRLVERYHRPTIMIAVDGVEGRGSGRSIGPFDLHDALSACAEHLTRYGGHRMAAGLSIQRDKIPAFRDAFDAVAAERLAPEDLVPTQRVDVVVPVAALTDELERLFRHLEPCGMGNPAPVLGVRGVGARDRAVVGSNHLRFHLHDATGGIPAIAFNWADRLPEEWWREPVDVALRLDRNEWRGGSTLQARVVDIRWQAP